jgi:hypothetical protein
MEQYLSKGPDVYAGISLAQKRNAKPFGVRDAQKFKPGELSESSFLQMWAKGEPFVVEGAMDNITPRKFMEMDNAGKLKVAVLTEETGKTEFMTWAQYFKRWTKARANKETLKVKVRYSNHFGFHN